MLRISSGWRLRRDLREPVTTAVAEEGLPVRDIAAVIGRRLKVPLVTKSPKEAAGYFGWLAPFLSVDNRVSSALTQELLGWRPARPGLIPDLEEGHYFNKPVLAREARKLLGPLAIIGSALTVASPAGQTRSS